MNSEPSSTLPAHSPSCAVDSAAERLDSTALPMSSAPEASSLHLREGSSEQPLAEPPTSTQLESSLACATATSSGTPSDLDASSQQQQGSKERRKVGLSWTEAEHRQFLQGLEKLGKGDWRGISRQFVTTRTPTQVASHAQKYYIRQTNQNRRKRRASLFDLANPEGHAQARSSPPASQATAAAAASDGEQFFSRAESSRATMPAEVSQSVAPSHSESLNCLQSRLASAPDSATQSLPSSSLACCHSSASDPRDVSQLEGDLLQQREPDFASCLLGPATVAPPSALDAYSLGQYAAHHQAAAAAAYATAMQQQAAAAYAQALMHQQASNSLRGLPPKGAPPFSGAGFGPHHASDRASAPSPANTFSGPSHTAPGSSGGFTASAFHRFQAPPPFQPPQHLASPQPLAASTSASAPHPSTSCYPSAATQMPWQHDSLPSLPAAISHWGHFMSHELECRPVAEHRGFGMLGFSPSWSAKKPPGMSHNSSVGTWQQSESDWGNLHSSAPQQSLAAGFGGSSQDDTASPEHTSAGAPGLLAGKPALPSNPGDDRPKAHEQAEFPAPSPFGGPSDQPATFANGKLHRPVAARPTLHGLVPPPMFMADDPNQCSGGSSMTQSLRPHP
ncbi:hypothetical protein WJX74_007356 [Apatococcus lobatus]|uniref:Uncharacterized protein n=1 Tax=Apatococcus lobatus TaxID=904363 RepID=A0AAW1R2L2_9CHLO